jgi:hypothetical protein
MTACVRLLTSVSSDERDRFAQLADARGLSVSRLLAGLVERALAESSQATVGRLATQGKDDRQPAEKYTVRLMGIDAAHLEARAQCRGLTPSGYAAHVLRAHLRTDPPMPYKEFEQLKRVINELAGVRGALQQVISERAPREMVEWSLRENIMRLLPALKQIREKIQDTLIANSKSWAAPAS